MIRRTTRWWVALALVGSVRAQDPPQPPKPEPPKTLHEYELKAAFLFQFAKYAQWPQSAFEDGEAPIVIGVVGADPFGDVLDRTLKDKEVDGRRFRVRRYARAADAKSCHILFVPRSEAPNLDEVLDAVGGSAVLTVGEDAGFARAGGCIGILVKDQKAKLEINVTAVRRNKLVIDTKLLRVSTIVGSE